MSKSDYIKESLKKSKPLNHYGLFGSQIPIYLKDELVFIDDKSSLEDVIEIVQNSLPSFLVSNVDVIYVGDFSFFQENARPSLRFQKIRSRALRHFLVAGSRFELGQVYLKAGQKKSMIQKSR